MQVPSGRSVLVRLFVLRFDVVDATNARVSPSGIRQAFSSQPRYARWKPASASCGARSVAVVTPVAATAQLGEASTGRLIEVRLESPISARVGQLTAYPTLVAGRPSLDRTCSAKQPVTPNPHSCAIASE